MNDRKISSAPEQAEVHAQALRPLTELARRELPPPLSPEAQSAAYARFRDATGAAGLPEGAAAIEGGGLLGRGARAIGMAAIAAALVLGGAATWRVLIPRPLSVSVARGALDEGGFVRAAPALAPSLRFSDGTEVDFSPSSRARVAETTRHGARVLLEEGRAGARVTPRQGARWFFDAGPCRVQVTGTHFDMRWSAVDQILEVVLYTGSVTVKGPPATAGVPVSAGQRLVMDVRQGSVRLTDLDHPSAAASPQSPPRADEELPTPEAVALAPSARTNPLPPGGQQGERADGAHRGEAWPARVLSGDFRAVIREAQRRGVDQVLRQDSAANVMALADAARYGGELPLAHRALLKVRARFPDSASAHRAAFLLGRMAEDQNGNLPQALQWYDTYLADAPDDALRAEAMGRKMTATLRLGHQDGARELAREYLRRYPQGPYARAAGSILAP